MSTVSESSAPPDRPLGQLGWVFFDGARSPYHVLVNIFVFSAYFTTTVVGDPVRGQTLWGYTSSAAAFLIALGAPVLGAIADAGGRRKPWLAGCLLLGLPSMALLWYATPAMSTGLGWILVAVAGGILFYEFSAIFCNAMLPRVAGSGAHIGLLSGLGYAFGNFSGVILFTFFLFAWSWNEHPLFGLDSKLHEPERAVGLLAGLWLVLFTPLLFISTVDSPRSALGARVAVRDGLRRLARTIARVSEYKNVIVFLIARMIFNEGFIVLMLFSGIYAAGVLHWTAEMLIIQGLVNSVAAALAGLFAGWLDARIGSKRSLTFFVVGCLVANLVVVSTTPESVFFFAIEPAAVPSTSWFGSLPDRVFAIGMIGLAIFITGGLASSRAMMAKLSPPHLLNEFFGIYAMSGTATSFLGPLAIGVLTTIFQSQRIGFASAVVFLLGGVLLLRRVREPV